MSSPAPQAASHYDGSSPAMRLLRLGLSVSQRLGPGLAGRADWQAEHGDMLAQVAGFVTAEATGINAP